MTSSKPKLFFWALTAALAGFLFGFDTGVISGAEQKIEKLWQLNSTLQGLAISAALWGTVAGALLGSWPTDRFGRKKPLIAIGLLYLISALWSALGSGTHWVFAALVALFFPARAKALHPGTTFAFFAVMMVLQLIWVKLKVPETKGRTLEDLEKELGTIS